MHAPSSTSQPFSPGKNGFRQHSLRLGAPSLLPLERASCQVGLIGSQPSSRTTTTIGDPGSNPAVTVWGDVSRSTMSPAPFAADSHSSRSHLLFGAASAPVLPHLPAGPTTHVEYWMASPTHESQEEGRETLTPNVPPKSVEMPAEETAVPGGIVMATRHVDGQQQVQPLDCPHNPLQALLSVLDADSMQVARQIESLNAFSAVSASDAARLLDIGTRLCSLAHGLLGTAHDSGPGHVPHSATVDEEDGMDVDHQLDDEAQEMSSEPSITAANEPAPVSAALHHPVDALFAPPFMFPAPVMAGGPFYFMPATPYSYFTPATAAAAAAAHPANVAAQYLPASQSHSARHHSPIPFSQSEPLRESWSRVLSNDHQVDSANCISIDIAGTLGIRPPPPASSTPSILSAAPIHRTPSSANINRDHTALATTSALTASFNRVRGPRPDIGSGKRRWTPQEYSTLERAVGAFGRAWTVILHAHGEKGLVDNALARFSPTDLHAKVEYELRKKRKAGLSDEQIGVFATAKPGVRGHIGSDKWDEIKAYKKQLQAEKCAGAGGAGESSGGEFGLEQASASVAASSIGTDTEDEESVHVE